MFRLPALAISLFLCLSSNITQAQKLYVQTYGSHKDAPIIFVHGGPRGNATLFEATTAQSLANAGFFVVVYDRRGEGRSTDPAATFTFAEAAKDLEDLSNKLSLHKASIIGHSFGGIVATMYAQVHPERVERLILVGALVAQQRTYDHILGTITKLAREKNDDVTLQKIIEVNLFDKQSAAYRGKTYDIASAYSFFRMPHPTEESEAVNKRYTESDFAKNNIRNDQAPILFYQNERQVNIDTTPILTTLKKRGLKLYGLYGKQDRIFSESQLNDLKKLVTPTRFHVIDNCSHYPFADQQNTFVETITKIMKN